VPNSQQRAEKRDRIRYSSHMKISRFFSLLIFLLFPRISSAAELVLREGVKTHLNASEWEVFQDKTHFGGRTSILQNKKTKFTILYTREISTINSSAKNKDELCVQAAKKWSGQPVTMKNKNFCHLKKGSAHIYYVFTDPKSSHDNVIISHQLMMQSNDPQTIALGETAIEKMEGFR
jgi:hypothetical protein